MLGWWLKKSVTKGIVLTLSVAQHITHPSILTLHSSNHAVRERVLCLLKGSGGPCYYNTLDHPPGPTWSHTAHGAPLTMDHTQADVYETCLKVKHPTSEVNTSHEGGAVWCTKRKEKPTSKKTRKRKPRLAGGKPGKLPTCRARHPFAFLHSRFCCRDTIRTGTERRCTELSITLIRLLHMQWDGPGR